MHKEFQLPVKITRTTATGEQALMTQIGARGAASSEPARCTAFTPI